MLQLVAGQQPGICKLAGQAGRSHVPLSELRSPCLDKLKRDLQNSAAGAAKTKTKSAENVLKRAVSQ
jgi:hypothetical protein